MATDTPTLTPTQAAPPAPPSTNGQAPASGEAEAPKEKAKRKWNGVYVQTPDVLREKLEAVAQSTGKSPAQYVRDHLAEMWSITLPPIQKRTKYANEDEKKAALTAKRKERQALINMLLENHRKSLEAAAAQGAPSQPAA